MAGLKMRKKGFTLIEMIFVLRIILVLVAIIVPVAFQELVSRMKQKLFETEGK